MGLRGVVLALLAAGCGGHIAGEAALDASSDGSSSGAVDATVSNPDAGADGCGGACGPESGAAGQDAASDAGGDGSVVLTDSGCVTTGNVAVVPFASNPALSSDGGSVVIKTSYSDPNCGTNSVIVVRTPQGGYAAYPDDCTHDCCELLFSGTDLACACHTDTFDLDGDVVDGSATAPLPVLPICWDSTAVYVAL